MSRAKERLAATLLNHWQLIEDGLSSQLFKKPPQGKTKYPALTPELATNESATAFQIVEQKFYPFSKATVKKIITNANLHFLNKNQIT